MNNFDIKGDAILEPLRSNKIAIAVFSAASTLGDFSIIWHVIGFIRAIGSTSRLQEAAALSVALGVESLAVNQGIKRIFRRQRPTSTGDPRFDIRTPSTSSFPSGHASSATFACIILVSFSGWPLGFIFVAIAAVVALSRVVVRIHHVTDIAGGIVCGAVLGSIAVPLTHSILSSFNA